MHIESVALVIRPYVASDEADVVELWRRCDLTVPWNDARRDIESKLRVQPDLFLVGTRAGRVVATVMAGYDGHRGWINYLGVAPELRRQHIATRLMHAAEAALRRHGCPKINLQVRGANANVVGFYERLGFAIEDRLSMGKRLE